MVEEFCVIFERYKTSGNSILNPGAPSYYVLGLISVILLGDNSSIDTSDKAMRGKKCSYTDNPKFNSSWNRILVSCIYD